MTEASKAGDLEVVLGLARKVNLPTKLVPAGYAEVEAATVGQIPTMLLAVAEVVPSLKKAGVSLTKADLAARKWPELSSEQWMTIIGENLPPLIRLVAAATDLDEKLVAKLKMDEFMELAVAVLEVNLDFFTHRFLPHLLDALAGAQAQAAQAMPAPAQ